jgi:hypothetical protein
MQRILLAGLLFATGCAGFVGPFQRPCQPPVRVDNPCLSIDEQEQRKREALALPEKSPEVGPRTYAEEPSYRYRDRP